MVETTPLTDRKPGIEIEPTTGREIDDTTARGSTSRTLRMIGNAHIDPVWLWRWPEGMAEVWATFRSALDRLAEYPEAIFTASSAAFHDWIERTDPSMFEEIRARVSEGRWAIAGGWWVEPDCNLPSGESFVRQGLYAQRYFRRAFGRIATVGWNPDSFGHNAMLPQILAKSGLESYVFMRPQPHEMALPRLFWWQSPDGSRVLAARIVHEYCGPSDDLRGHLGATLEKLAGEEWADLLWFYGVGNHGGGPTKANLDGIRRMAAGDWPDATDDGANGPTDGTTDNPTGVPADSLSDGPRGRPTGRPLVGPIDGATADRPALVHARPDDYFDAVRTGGASIPVVAGELQHHARGCYAANSDIKRLNRSTEQLLLAAEKVAALTSWETGTPYPDDFEEAWRALLFNQFHDVLAGTSIESAYDDARDGFGLARSIAARNLHAGVARLARRIDIPVRPESWPIVAFNTHAWPVRVPVSLEFRRIHEGDVLVDDADHAVPFQLAQSEATVSGGRARPVWLADLPPMGFRVYRLLTGDAAASTLSASLSGVAADDTWAETERVRLDVDEESGTFSVRDLESGAELLSGGGRAVVLRDESDTWSHGIARFDDVVGEFRPASVHLVERGPVRAVIRIVSHFQSSRLVQDVALCRGLDRVHVSVTLDWREPRHLLKLRFPTSFLQPHATYEIPYGAIERPADGAEEPGQAWLDVSGWLPGLDGSEREFGLSIANDGKYSYDVSGSSIGLTVARSPIYAHHEPKIPDEVAEYSYLDTGRQHFEYVVLPHRADWRGARTVRAAAELIEPPIALPETFHAGTLPQCHSFVAVDHPAVVVSALKIAEDDATALVVRAVETSGAPARATIELAGFGRWIDASFSPFEIKTYLVPRDERSPVIETDLLERPLQPHPDRT